MSRRRRHRHPAEYYFLLRSDDSGSAPPRARVSKASKARDTDSFVTTLNVTPLGLDGIFGLAISRSVSRARPRPPSVSIAGNPSLGAERAEVNKDITS
jgi:hypothetical protein